MITVIKLNKNGHCNLLFNDNYSDALHFVT